ncbi:hypothetical protein FACS189476_06650 [Spirochaetia bacterium]|nr:hypothetical protein FACS189476_06650 [Spirochaetia bacterium]
MIHWSRIKKIKAALLEAENGNENSRRKVELSPRKIADMLEYVKRYYKEEPQAAANKFSSSKIAAVVPGFGVAAIGAHLSSGDDLDGYIKENRNKIFTNYLKQKMNEWDITITDLYKLARLHRSIKQKIEWSSDLEPYQPDKDTVIKIGMAMQMKLDEMNEFLAAAGFALANNDKKDIVIKYCITKKIYDLYEIDACVLRATDKSLYKLYKENR